MSKCNLINEERLFSHVIPNIGSKGRMVEELVENAVRAKAKNIVFIHEIDGAGNTSLTVENDGEILEDFTSLLKIAESDYDETVIRTQQPAGMGIMMMLSASMRVTFHSGRQRLTVERDPFFGDSGYRNTILDHIEKTDEVVEGMKMTFDITGEANFIAKAFQGRLGFYSIDISYNDIVIEKCAPEFLLSKEGSGILRGATIGIENKQTAPYFYDSSRGRIIWFGKVIESAELAPFTIVVGGNAEIKALSPRLPDRTGFVNTEDELAAVKRELEDQLADTIQEYLNVNKEAPKFLHHTLRQYDVEHFEEWKGAKRDETRLVLTDYDARFSLIETGNDLLKPAEEFEVRLVDFGEAPIVQNGYHKIGGCTPPAWYQELIFEGEPLVVAYGSPLASKAAGMGDWWLYPAERILLEGIEIAAIADYEDGFYVSKDHDLDWFFSELSESLDEYNQSAINDKLWASYNAAIEALEKRVTTAEDLLRSLRTLSGKGWREKIEKVEFDMEAHEIMYVVGGEIFYARF